MKIKSTDVDKDLYVITIDSEKISPSLKISELIDTTTLEIIPLETNINSMLGMIMIPRIDNEGNIYIKDEIQDIVFKFSNEGKFLGKIDKLGRGPGEYTSIGDFIVDEGKIKILNHFKIMCYDKNSLELDSIIYFNHSGFGALQFHADELYYYFIPSNAGDIQASVVVCDKMDMSIRSIYKESTLELFAYISSTPFIDFKNNVYFHRMMNDTLFRITNEVLSGKIFLDCKGFGLDGRTYANLQENDPFLLNISDKYIYAINRHVVNDLFFTTSARKGRNTLLILHSFDTKNTRVVDLNDIKDDVFNLRIRFTLLASGNDGYFYAEIYPSYFTQNGKIDENHLLYGVKEEDNPVVLKFRLRDF